MRTAFGEQRQRRLRVAFAWLLTVLVIAVYFTLPDGEEPLGFEPTPAETAEVPGAPRSLEITDVSPARPSPGRAITINYTGAAQASQVRAFVGKQDVEVLARSRGSLVLRLPENLPPGRIKLRLVEAGERSKPYTVSLKAVNFRKPFRNLIGGFALLTFGIGVLARAAREAAGLASASTFARLSARRGSLLGLGGVLGAFAQSTTASAAILAGLVASSLLSVAPAAVAFLGAQLGATVTPLVTGLIDPREGLVAIALGVFWLSLVSDRRSAALARLVLGTGLVALGLQTFRPGFELFVQDPALLEFVSKLKAHGAGNIAISAALGVALVALLQGPAPVVLLVLVLAQTTAQWDLRTALSVLSGSGFGAAVGALLTTPAGRKCRQLATLNLLLGAAGTLFTACTVNIWSGLADWLVPGVPHAVDWSLQQPLPNLAPHLGVAFALSQTAAALLLLPISFPLARWLERRFAPAPLRAMPRVGDAAGVGRAELSLVLHAQRTIFEPLRTLVQQGNRSAGRLVEHRLAEARARLEELLAGPLLALPDTSEGRRLSGAAFTSMQLQRALEGLHRQAERLIDRHITASGDGAGQIQLSAEDDRILGSMHELLLSGISELLQTLDSHTGIDLEQVRAREIRINGLEASARNALRSGHNESTDVGSRLSVLELVDAYETAGNQLYRLAEALDQSAVEPIITRTG
ncbi:MAG TPA: hypothetical protein VG937_23155 [Polyangiaceae bacterium]|nr:hypothetical protein [Polyangiaceae bacterium]